MEQIERIHMENVAYLERLFRDGKVTAIPTPTNLRVRFFKSGGGNHLYLVEADAHRYLARINYYPLKNEWQIKAHEFAVLKHVESLEIAPKAYYLDATSETNAQHCIVVDFIEGEQVKEFAPATIRHLAQTLHKLHTSVPFDASGDRLPPSDPPPYQCDVFANFATGEDKQIERYQDLAGIEQVITPFNETRAKLGAWFENLPIFDGIDTFCLCHADLKAENILRTADGVRLIDWEQAGSDIPETDIAGLFSGCRFNAEQEQLFLDEYYPTGTEQLVLDRIQAIQKVLDFFRIIEDYIILHRKPWNAERMAEEITRFHIT